MALKIRSLVSLLLGLHSGVCNYLTGKCACFDGMISSNGQSAVGLREDCGLVQAVEDPLAKNLLLQG